MAQFTAKIIDKVGIHARPASILAKEASKFQSDIKIKSDGKEGNLKSIMNVMALAIKSGTDVTIEASGPDETEAISSIEKVLKENAIIE